MQHKGFSFVFCFVCFVFQSSLVKMLSDMGEVLGFLGKEKGIVGG